MSIGANKIHISSVEHITGNVGSFLHIHPWTQFYDLKDRKDIPMSYGRDVTMRDIDVECNTFFDVRQANDQYHLSNFTFENLTIKAKNGSCDRSIIDGFEWNNVNVNP